MARPIWSGFLSFGLVNVPVGLYSATVDRTVHFNQLHAGTSHRVRYQRVDEVTGEQLEMADIVNGYHVGGGEYIVVTRDELRDAAPGRSETIEISDFVELSEVDPIYFRQSYYLAPKGKGADRAYALLRRAMEESGKVGIATFVLRDKEHLAAIRPGSDVLTLETMYFADEIVDAKAALDSLPDDVEANPRELEVAKQLIGALTTTWDPSRYENRYRARVEDLIEKKREGRSVVFEEERPTSNVIDLMRALEASVARTPKREDERVAEAPETSGGRSRRRGATAAAEPAPGRPEQQRFEGMSKAELVEQAEAMKLEVNSRMTKADLVEVLREAEARRPARRRRAS